MKSIFTILFALFIPAILFAQQNQTGNKRKCGTYELHLQRLQNEPGYATQYAKLQDFTQQFVSQHPEGYQPKAVVTVPVVFHIVLSSAQHTSFPDSRILEQITVLNQDYGGTNPHPMGTFASSLKADCELVFCLAAVDPTGNPTTGIVRVNYSGPQWGMNSDLKHSATGGSDQWDPDRYLNVWVCDLGSGLCGYALMPTPPLSNEFGLVTHFEYTGTTNAVYPYDEGGTVTHEIGHCFNLNHIWGDSPGCTPDDLCADTPPQDNEFYGNPAFPQLDACTGTAPGVMFCNFMDYVNDEAYANFTPDQKTRIHACFAPGGPLELLGQSDACGPPLHADFSGTPTLVNVNSSVAFTDLSTGSPTGWSWNFTGGTPAIDATGTPPAIFYNTVGTYTVSLTVTKNTSSDTETKTAYIEVIDPTAVNADFVGVPTVVIQGGQVDFQDLSTNNPTTRSWTFAGGTPGTSVLAAPQNITYNTPGLYSVTLTASNGSTSDTETKDDYILVIDSNDVPHANFIANFTNIFVGGTVDFTNLSTGIYDSLLWVFEGGAPGTSTVNDPTGIIYSALGDYDVTLILYSGIGNDTLYKPDYIHVLDPAFADSLIADFHAISGRLIVYGNGVSFEDLTDGYPTSWTWTFFGAATLNSTTQNPLDIVYPTPGIYDVMLVVSNGTYTDTIIKEDYIVVTTEPWPDPNGFCDTVTNVGVMERPLTFMHLAPHKWGYLPGHNQDQIKYYAEKYTNYTFSDVTGLLVPVVKSYNESNTGKVRFTVWNVDSLGKPGTVLGYKDESLDAFTPYLFHPVHFTNPIPVNGHFFIGFQLYYYSPQDTFVVYITPNRGPAGENKLYLKKGSNWITPTQYFNDTMIVNTSLGIKILGCLVGVDEVNLDENLEVYPNPANSTLYIEMSEEAGDKAAFDLFDITGREWKPETVKGYGANWEMSISNLPEGIYMLRVRSGNATAVRRVVIIR